jgi:hypothetical protein
MIKITAEQLRAALDAAGFAYREVYQDSHGIHVLRGHDQTVADFSTLPEIIAKSFPDARFEVEFPEDPRYRDGAIVSFVSGG